MQIELNEKLHGIMQSEKLDDLPLKYLPPVSDTPDNYYFISYSHKDYKLVYSDIYALQTEGVNVWYDRAMPAGKSWKETAEKYIRPSRCAGVVFYISENALLSPAIHEEIAFAKKCGKSCLTINIPLSDGKSVSAKEMLDQLISQGKQITTDKYDFICNSFGTDVLYLPYSAEADVKAEKISGLRKPPLLNISKADNMRAGVAALDEIGATVRASVVAVNDSDVAIVQLSDFDAENSRGNKMKVDIIDDCAFANCALLKKVELPAGIREVRDYAFYNCGSLKSVSLPDVKLLGESVFEYCVSLEEVTLSCDKPLFSINPRTFFACKSLKRLSLPESVSYIGDEAFALSGLTEIFISDNIDGISESAFEQCFDLSKIVVDKANPKYASFCNCLIDKEQKILMCGTPNSVLPNDGSITTIANQAFSCKSGFSMRNYYEIYGQKTVYRHAEYGDVALSDLKLCDNCIVIPQGVQKIQPFAFNQCGLKEIVLPDSITAFYPQVFYECNYLERICFVGTKAQWAAIDKNFGIMLRSDYVSRRVTVQCLDGVIFTEI